MPPAPKHIRRRFRFGVWAVLAFVTAISLPLGWIAIERYQSRYELGVVERLRMNDGGVVYGTLNESWDYYGREPDDWWHRLLVNVLGKRILACELNDQTISDDDLSLLAAFSNLQAIWATNCTLGDLARLKSLKKLKVLCLVESPIREVRPLAAFEELQFLMLYDFKGTQEEIDILQTALPNCKIDYTFAR
ncbi:MAG TPA: hypothetical protein VHD36_24170 [Pirellulales bacterium]|nr:hypothetical protein [Pirellulales bacterium]